MLKYINYNSGHYLRSSNILQLLSFMPKLISLLWLMFFLFPDFDESDGDSSDTDSSSDDSSSSDSDSDDDNEESIPLQKVQKLAKPNGKNKNLPLTIYVPAAACLAKKKEMDGPVSKKKKKTGKKNKGPLYRSGNSTFDAYCRQFLRVINRLIRFIQLC